MNQQRKQTKRLQILANLPDNERKRLKKSLSSVVGADLKIYKKKVVRNGQASIEDWIPNVDDVKYREPEAFFERWLRYGYLCY